MALIAQNQANFGTQGIAPIGDRFGQNAQTNPLGDLEVMISTGIGVLTIVAALFFIFYFVLGALKWVTAGGDGGKVGKARDEMIQGVIGLIVIVAAYGLVGLIGTVVGINILQPAQEILRILPAATN